MTLSVFDIFKVGIGPSSSHTMGPMRAAREFVHRAQARRPAGKTTDIAVRLYGSLALTGRGHGTDRAILAGLEGAQPESVDPDSIDPTVARIRASGRINLLGEHEVGFDEPMQLLFMMHERLPRHSNGMRFTALGAGQGAARGRLLLRRRRLRGARGRAGGARDAHPRRAAVPVHLRGRPAQPVPRARHRAVRADAGQRVHLEHPGGGAREAAAYLGGDAGVRGARLPPDRAAARGAQGAPPRTAPVPHAHRERHGEAAGGASTG